MKFRYVAFAAALAALFGAASSATAGAYLYAGQRKHIYCGVLAITNRATGTIVNGNGIDNAGRLFFVMEQHSELKPSGWSFENPFAPGSPSTGLGKDDTEYWVVNLAATRSLSRMNVLYLPASGAINLDDQDREKLRRFVDGGGVLWIDNTGSPPLDFGNSFFIGEFGFTIASGGFEQAFSRHHPILSSPHLLSMPETASLGSPPGEYDCDFGYDQGNPPSNFDILLPVVTNTLTNKPSVAANVYGSGRIVATANYVGYACCKYSYPYNVPDLKFAYNVVAWASAYSTLRKDPRHTGSTIDTVGGSKLVEQWCLSNVAPATGSSAAPAENGPVIYKNAVFYTGMLNGVSTLFAIDLYPTTDLDGDGNVDDGMRGLSTLYAPGSAPQGVDLLWYYRPPEPGTLSAPTVVSIQDPGQPGSTTEAVLVTSSSGYVYMLKAFPNVDGILIAITNPADLVLYTYRLPALISPNIAKPMPPLYINGWIYAVNGEGRLCAYNPSLEAWANVHPPPPVVISEWQMPGPSYGSWTDVEPKTGPTFGFVQNNTSGAVIGVVYWYVSTPNPSGPPPNDRICGVPVFCSNDRLKINHTTTDHFSVECRISYSSATISDSPRPIVWYKDSAGNRIEADTVLSNRRISGGAIDNTSFVLGMIVATFSSQIPPDATVYATYALSYDNTSTAGPPITISPPPQPVDVTTPQTVISSLPALGPDNMTFITGTRSGAGGGGSVYGIHGDGTTGTTKWHYFLHSGDDLPTDLNPAVQRIPGVVADFQTDADGRTIVNNMVDPQSFSSPAYAGDKVFVTVTSTGTSTSDADPKAALLCFKANSDFVIRITGNAGLGLGGKMQRQPKKLYSTTNNRRMSVKIWQPNLIDTGGLTLTSLMSAIPVPSDMIDYDNGTITFDNFDRLRLKSGGSIPTNTFSPSLPVWVFLDNIGVPVDFSTWAPSVRAAGGNIPAITGDSVDLSGWNNLLWYYVVPPYEGRPCSGVHSSPIVIGNTIYFVTDDGVLYALNTETGESQSGPIDSKNVIWQTKISTGVLPDGANISPAGADGVLLVPLSDGLHAFANSMTLVADNNRVVELDGSGDVAWSVDSVMIPVSVPTSTTQTPPVRGVPVNKPARVRYIGSGDILVVNSGANQVCRINRGGYVGVDKFNSEKYIRWAFDRFCDPKGLLRPGQPLKLSSPTDAILWQEMEADGWATVHCLVADSGAHRILDLVYPFSTINGESVKKGDLHPACERDPKTGFYLPYVNWVSRTESMNQKYTFTCMQIVDATDSTVLPRVIKNRIWAAISNYGTGNDPGSNIGERGLGGAIVAFEWREMGENGWNYNTPGSGEIVQRCDHVDWGGGTPKPLANPRFFQVIETPNPNDMHMLVCDNYGVYDVLISSTPPAVGNFLLDKDAVPDSIQDYRGLPRDVTDESTGTVVRTESLGAPLLATSVQLLHNGHWLISNGWSGQIGVRGRSFSGEVFQYDPVNCKVVWSSPNIVAANETAPWEQRMGNSSILEQPRSALRQ